MITRNLRNLTAMMLQSSSTAFGSLLVRGVNGRPYYAHGVFSFPASRAEAFTLNAEAAGVSFGTGSTPATENDINLENTITSGITVTLTGRVVGCDAPGSPYVQYSFMVSNSLEEPLTIREVGYKQSVKCATTPGRNNSVDAVCLLDRTVLDAPLTIAAGDAGVLVYKLKTNPMPPTVISGIEIVSFEWGSDEQIAAMIDAAHAGTIDLQRDAHWRVGNMRKIHIDAFTGGGSVAHAAQDIDIMISSFEDYNNCGCVLQFDFVEALAKGQRMHSDKTNYGGYGATEMKNVTLPALIEALPVWLQEHLIPFDVLVTLGQRSTEIETISGNRLALRSVTELFGESTPPIDGCQIEIYKEKNPRIKNKGYSGSVEMWWLRSPDVGSFLRFGMVSKGGDGTAFEADLLYGCAPFGCV